MSKKIITRVDVQTWQEIEAHQKSHRLFDFSEAVRDLIRRGLAK